MWFRRCYCRCCLSSHVLAVSTAGPVQNAALVRLCSTVVAASRRAKPPAAPSCFSFRRRNFVPTNTLCHTASWRCAPDSRRGHLRKDQASGAREDQRAAFARCQLLCAVHRASDQIRSRSTLKVHRSELLCAFNAQCPSNFDRAQLGQNWRQSFY